MSRCKAKKPSLFWASINCEWLKPKVVTTLADLIFISDLNMLSGLSFLIWSLNWLALHLLLDLVQCTTTTIMAIKLEVATSRALTEIKPKKQLTGVTPKGSMTFCNLAHNSLSMKLSEGDKVLCNLQLLWDFSISFPSTDFGLFAAGLKDGWVGKLLVLC